MNDNFQQITSYIVSLVSLLTATGVFMHDMRVDKAVSVALAEPEDVVTSDAEDTTIAERVAEFMAADDHTHPDFKPARSLMNGFTYRTPGTPPREREHNSRKQLKKTEPTTGRHAFDNTNLPIVE